MSLPHLVSDLSLLLSGSVTGIMVETRSITNGTGRQESINTNEHTVESLATQLTALMGAVNTLTNDMRVMQQRFDSGEGPSQRSGVSGAQNGILGGQMGQHNQNNGGQYGRLSKIEFPKFDGEDVQGWLYRVKRFFEMDQIMDDDQKIRLVSMHVFGKALNWHTQFMRRFGEVITWDVYEIHVRKRFESVFSDPVMELKNLKQTSSVQVYQESFEALLNKVDTVDLPDTCTVSLFIGGLKDEIAYAIRMFMT